MKKFFMLLLAITIPVLFFIDTWQGYRYQKLISEVENLESEQRNWLEKNKMVIAKLAVFRSPVRIEEIAENVLELKKVDSNTVIKAILIEDE